MTMLFNINKPKLIFCIDVYTSNTTMVNVWNFPGAYPTIALTATVASTAIYSLVRSAVSSTDVMLLKSSRDEMYDNDDVKRRSEWSKHYLLRSIAHMSWKRVE